MATGMIEIMKIAAMEAIDNANPCDVRFGTVSSVSPLSVRISSDLILPESVLVVPEHLTDYTTEANIGLNESISNAPGGSVDISVVDETLIFTDVPIESIEVSVIDETLIFSNSSIATVEVESESEIATEGVDERTITFYNGLEVGDNVVLLRNQGGKQYLILDRV